MGYSFAGRYGAYTFLSATGAPLDSTPFTVYLAGTTTLATLYQDRTKVATVPNPSSTDGSGNATFFADPGTYDVVVSGITRTVSVDADPAEFARLGGANVFLAQQQVSPLGPSISGVGGDRA